MAKKKTEKKRKSVTMDDLAIMVNKGFQSVTNQVSDLEGRVIGIEGKMESAMEKMD